MRDTPFNFLGDSGSPVGPVFVGDIGSTVARNFAGDIGSPGFAGDICSEVVPSFLGEIGSVAEFVKCCPLSELLRSRSGD